MQATLLNDVKVTVVKTTQSTATSAVNTDSVDMTGFDGVVFVGALATANAGNSVNLAQSSDNSTFVDLAGTAQVPGTNGDLVAIDLFRPSDRYVRAEIVRAGATTVTETFYAIQYRGRKSPITSIATQETHVSPDEGTA